MPDKLIIEGKSKVKGTIDVRGSKNAATPIIAATLLTTQPCVLDNLPLVEDVRKMLDIVEQMGAEVDFLEERKVRITAKDIKLENLTFDLVNKMRSSILLVGPLVARFGFVKIPQPGGCVIGSRPIDVHLDALSELGVEIEEFGLKKNGSKSSNTYHFRVNERLKGREVVLEEFSVTATENILMAATLAEGKTVINTAACEPHVQDLALFLKKMGADIKGEGTSRIEVKGKEKLSGAEHFISYDYVEAGTFLLMSLASGGNVRIKNAPVSHMKLLLSKLKSSGGKIEEKEDEIIVHPSKELSMEKVQTLPHPGIPTDLQAPLGAFATQTKGLTLVHDPLYEGRLKYLEQLNKMGAEIVVCDPHRAIINGPTRLHGVKLDPLDLRAGAALIIAGLVAEGTTIIRDISQADRGYERIEERLWELGAKVKRVKENENG